MINVATIILTVDMLEATQYQIEPDSIDFAGVYMNKTSWGWCITDTHGGALMHAESGAFHLFVTGQPAYYYGSPAEALAAWQSASTPCGICGRRVINADLDSHAELHRRQGQK